MKNFKNLLFTFISLFLIGIINVDATVTVSGEDLTGTKQIGGGTITLKDNVLTIDSVNLTLNDSTYEFLNIDNEDVKIVLKGENVITNNGSKTIIHGNNNTVTITGEGSLKSTSKLRNIWVTGTLILDGAKLDITSTINQSDQYAIEADNLTIKNRSNVKVVSNGVSIGSYSAILIKDSGVDAESKATFHSTILANKTKGLGTITIENSTVKTNSAFRSFETAGNVLDTDTTNTSSVIIKNSNITTTNGTMGISALGNVEITNSKVNMSDFSQYGIYTKDGKYALLTINNSKVTLTGKSGKDATGIQTYDGLKVNKSELYISDMGGYGVYATLGVNLTDSYVILNDVYWGIRVYTKTEGYDIKVNKSLLAVDSTTYAFKKQPIITNANGYIISENTKTKLTTESYNSNVKKVLILPLYNVTINNDKNTTISTEKTLVKELGEELELTITPNKGYKLTSVLVNDTESLTNLVDNKLTLTINEDTTIKVTSKAYETTIETPVIDTTKEVKEVTIGVDADKTVKETLEKALEDSKLDVSTFDSKIEIAVETKKESDVPETELESINTLVKTKENMKVSTFFDITINVVNTENNNVVGTLTELNKELTFKVQLPTDLAKVEVGYTRTYNIIRYHDGESTLLDATLEGNVLTFKTDKFSTYAVAYTDTKKEDKTTTPDVIDNPKTLDNIALYGVTGIISLIGFASIMYVINKKRKNN